MKLELTILDTAKRWDTCVRPVVCWMNICNMLLYFTWINLHHQFYCLSLLQDGLANPKSKESISKEGKVTERIIERIIICPGGQPYMSPPPQPPLQPCPCPSQQGGEKKKKGKKKRIDEDDGLCNHPYCIVQRSKLRPQGWVLSKVNFIIKVCWLTCIYVCTYIMYIVSKSC